MLYPSLISTVYAQFSRQTNVLVHCSENLAHISSRLSIILCLCLEESRVS